MRQNNSLKYRCRDRILWISLDYTIVSIVCTHKIHILTIFSQEILPLVPGSPLSPFIEEVRRAVKQNNKISTHLGRKWMLSEFSKCLMYIYHKWWMYFLRSSSSHVHVCTIPLNDWDCISALSSCWMVLWRAALSVCPAMPVPVPVPIPMPRLVSRFRVLSERAAPPVSM